MSSISGRLWVGSSDSAGITNHKVTAIAKESSRAGGEPAILRSRGRVDYWEGSVVFHGAAVPLPRESWMSGAALGSGAGCETEELLGGEEANSTLDRPGWCRTSLAGTACFWGKQSRHRGNIFNRRMHIPFKQCLLDVASQRKGP